MMLIQHVNQFDESNLHDDENTPKMEYDFTTIMYDAHGPHYCLRSIDENKIHDSAFSYTNK